MTSRLIEGIIEGTIPASFHKDKNKVSSLMATRGGSHEGEVWSKNDTYLTVNYSFESKADAEGAMKLVKSKYPWVELDSIKPAKSYFSDPAGTKRVTLRVQMKLDSYV